MSKSLTLIPLDWDESDEAQPPYGLSVLRCNVLSDLRHAVEDVEHKTGKRVPYGTYCPLGGITVNPWGAWTNMVPAYALAALQQHGDVAEDPRNRAAWAYIAAMKSIAWVALWWT